MTVYNLVVLLSQFWAISSSGGQIIVLCPVSPNCCCCFSVTQLCLTLCYPMNCSTLGFPVHHHFPEFAQVQVHGISPTISSSDALFSFHPQSFPASGTCPMIRLLASDEQNSGALASASVLPVNIQSWSPLRLTGLILLSKRFSGVFSSTTVWRQQFFGVQGGTIPGLLLSLQAYTICRCPSLNLLQCDPKLR